MSKDNVFKTKEKEHSRLGQWFATAICGNDILSSAFYVSGISIIYAGIYSPIVLLIIGLVLFFYKSVYIEVVEALPTNGGAYNCLLNATSKNLAALAGTITLLSYVATAVISGEDGMQYLNSIIHVPVLPLTIGILLLFAILVISGIKDSAKVALSIFSFHILVLLLFVALGLIYIFHGNHPIYLSENFFATIPIVKRFGGIIQAIFFGFSASLLGVSGFESSANFVEEQKRGVFRKTLRNMLIGSVIFNPLTSFIALSILPLSQITASSGFLLSNVAKITGGVWFDYILVIDAAIVLSGAVLTAFVGVSGLVYRMTSDGCFPGFLNKVNKKGSYSYIVIGFFLLSVSILILTKGNLLSLAGVYTIAFLLVMTLFAIGNLLMRQTRKYLKRTYSAPFLFVIFAFLSTLAGITGNIEISPENLKYFLIYFIPSGIIVLATIYFDLILRFIVSLTQDKFPQIREFIKKHFDSILEGEFVVFINHIDRIHQILEYVDKNEIGRKIYLIICKNIAVSEAENMAKFEEVEKILPILKEAGVYPHLEISPIYLDQLFGPKAIDYMAKKMKIDKNRILIGSIHHEHKFDYEELGGARIIF